MSVPLVKKLDGFENVCNYYADNLIKAGVEQSFDKQDFIDWMMLSKKYSPSGYMAGMFGDSLFYYHCYKIYKKMRSDTNQHHMVLVCGKIGKGKSTLGLQIAALVDPSLGMDRVCYVPPHLFRRLSRCIFGQSNVIDEGGNFFKARNSMTKIGRDISQAFQLVRDLRQVLVVCYDEPEKLDRDIIDKFDSMFIKVYDPKESGNNRFKSYYGYGVRSLDKVKVLLKKKVPASDTEILKLRNWRGHNSSEIPVINDVNEQTYRSEKRKYLKDHMELLANKYEEEFKEIDGNKKESVGKFVTISEAAKLLNLHPTTIHNKIGRGQIPSVSVGKKKLIPHGFFTNLYENAQIQGNFGASYNLSNPEEDSSK